MKRGGTWIDLSHREVAEQVQDLSLGLRELGLNPGDRVALLSENRPEWAITDYACLTARCPDVPIYPTLPDKQVEYILRDSGAAIVFVSTEAQLDKVLAVRERLPDLRCVVAFDPVPARPGVLGLGEALAAGRAARDRHPDWRAQALAAAPGDLATIIYTSGTTGEPKGVMLTHGNVASNVTTCVELLDFTPQDECLSFLPLSHIFERMFGHYMMFHCGVVIGYAGGIETVPRDLLERHPTLMASVPRLYEKIYARALETALAGPPLKRRLFLWAQRIGETWADLHSARRRVPWHLHLQHLVADRLVLGRLRTRMGGRVRFFVSGGAPLAAEIGKFFYAAGMPILEGYGLTETAPVIAVNTPLHFRFGTVGRPIPGVEVRIAPDGEILARGPNVMRGYYGKPEATAEAIDAEGWFHTGDIGLLDGNGFLRITDRKKDLIVTAGGKNIAPQPIENLAKTNKFVVNAVMVGDRRPFPIMLVVPNFDALRGWAERIGVGGTAEAMLASPAVREKLEGELRGTLRDLAHFEVPKRYLFLARDFSLEAGELTPTLKIRRRAVEEHHRAAIEELYRH